ncbi:hypothetical protein ACFL9T_21980 [Thermodesulfobacteriota bacterium]
MPFQTIKKYDEDHGRKAVGESVPAGGWKLLKDKICTCSGSTFSG